jgi:hypothetical protein
MSSNSLTVESIANSAFLAALDLSQTTIIQLGSEPFLKKIVTNAFKIINAYKDFLDSFHFLKLLLAQHDNVSSNEMVSIVIENA